MLYTSHFKKLFLAFIGVIIFVEILVRIFPIYYFEKPEKFLIYSTRKLIENGNNNYDVIILGDSTSMSLNPGPFKNIFNFSMPAMGVRYYPFFVKKYLKYNNRKPKAIIFSGSFSLVSTGKGLPLVSLELLPYAYPDISLKKYIYNRTIKRLNDILQGKTFTQEEIYNMVQGLQEWEIYSQRYLTLFSAWEINDQYRGPEWFYIMSQSIPLLYNTYTFRNAIQNIFNMNTYKFEKNSYGTFYCSCDKLLLKVCQPPTSQYQDNQIIDNFRKIHNGYYNISDRLSPELLQAFELEKGNTIKKLQKHAKIKPNFDFSYTAKFISNLNKKNILFIYLVMPYPNLYKNEVLLPSFFKEFEEFLKQFPNTKMYYFPTMYYDAKFYADMVHLNCEGAKKLNDEFQNIVLPQIIEYVNKHSK